MRNAWTLLAKHKHDFLAFNWCIVCYCLHCMQKIMVLPRLMPSLFKKPPFLFGQNLPLQDTRIVFVNRLTHKWQFEGVHSFLDISSTTNVFPFTLFCKATVTYVRIIENGAKLQIWEHVKTGLLSCLFFFKRPSQFFMLVKCPSHCRWLIIHHSEKLQQSLCSWPDFSKLLHSPFSLN